MSQIHHRIVNGTKVYRLWSTVSGGYLTYDLTYDELVTELRIEAIREALRSVEGPLFEQRMARVHHNGTSEGVDRSAKPLDRPWDAERDDSDDETEDE
jgi:hypothetical protein